MALPLNVDGTLESLALGLRRSTVQVRQGDVGGGAGIIWRGDGLIVTNAHVVGASGRRPTVELWDGRRYDAEVRQVHRRRDLAVLQVPARDLPTAASGDSRALRPGEIVVALGHPSGRAGAVTVGVVHSSGDGRWIKADVHLAPGNSGGPLANARGEIVGVNTLIQFSGAGRGLALAVPSHAVSRFLAGGGEPGRLGVTMQRAVVSMPRGPCLGLVVVDVFARGAGARAGLAPGDVLIGEGDHFFRDVDDLAYVLEEAGAGGTVELLVLRAGQGCRLAVRLEAQGRAA